MCGELSMEEATKVYFELVYFRNGKENITAFILLLVLTLASFFVTASLSRAYDASEAEELAEVETKPLKVLPLDTPGQMIVAFEKAVKLDCKDSVDVIDIVLLVALVILLIEILVMA
ncbi:hypothetical protein E3N88_05693 [Mikania micrantha]|uniref:Uncharacterized protein n=1 Tax=Mikania micrantha TaxID=192012 RepID=A0A5N6PNS1_9ASTR|nr:hypothetical protein E3N88_05693 [Mikania micrantha]